MFGAILLLCTTSLLISVKIQPMVKTDMEIVYLITMSLLLVLLSAVYTTVRVVREAYRKGGEFVKKA